MGLTADSELFEVFAATIDDYVPSDTNWKSGSIWIPPLVMTLLLPQPAYSAPTLLSFRKTVRSLLKTAMSPISKSTPAGLLVSSGLLPQSLDSDRLPLTSRTLYSSQIKAWSLNASGVTPTHSGPLRSTSKLLPMHPLMTTSLGRMS